MRPVFFPHEVDDVVLLRPEIEADVTGAGKWHNSQQPSLGPEFREEIIRVFDALMENPVTTFTNWLPTPTVTNTYGTHQFDDTEASGFRFYRAAEVEQQRHAG